MNYSKIIYSSDDGNTSETT